MVYGTKSEDVIFALSGLPRSKRLKVWVITLDLSPTMRLIARMSLPNVTLVSDCFHVQRLMNEAVNDLRIDFRRQATDLENRKTALAGEVGSKCIPAIIEHGDTRRQLPARNTLFYLQTN
jgi:hypothetical protein